MRLALKRLKNIGNKPDPGKWQIKCKNLSGYNRFVHDNRLNIGSKQAVEAKGNFEFDYTSCLDAVVRIVEGKGDILLILVFDKAFSW